MATRGVELTEEDGAFLDGLVARRSFPDLGAAMAEAMALLREDEAKMDALVLRLNRAHDEAARGARAPGTGEDAVRRAFQRAQERYAARHAADQAAE